MIGMTKQCGVCRHFRSPLDQPGGDGMRSCAAFTSGIPEALWVNEADHRLPFVGDGGIRWAPRHGAEFPEYAFEMGGRLSAHLFNAAPDPALTILQADFEAALAELTAQYGQQITPQQQAEIEQQVQEAVDSGDLSALAAISVGTAAAALLILAALKKLANLAAAGMVAELAVTGLAGVAAVTTSVAALRQLAEATAASLGAGLASAAGAEALRLAAPGVSGADVAAGAGTFVEGLSGRGLQDQLAGALTRAQNEARLLTANVPQVLYFASEVNDKNTCRQLNGDPIIRCHEIDGTQFENWKAAWDAYAGGTYRHCKGRWRCRGTVVARWNPEAGL